MDGQEYLDLLKKRLAHYYDIKETQSQIKPAFILSAELHAADEGYFVVPNLKTYSVQHNEYLYVQRFTEPVTQNMLAPCLAFTQQAMQEFKTTTEHMSSLFTLVCLCEAGVEKNELDELTKIKQHKDYCFTLKGWSDLALYFIDIPEQKIYYNKAAKKNLALFAFPEK